VSIVETDEVRGRHTSLQRIQTVSRILDFVMRTSFDHQQRYIIFDRLIATQDAVASAALSLRI
jgi:hypothetical protein